VDKVDAMDKVDWITCGVWRPRAALHVIYCLVAALPRCVNQCSSVSSVVRFLVVAPLRCASVVARVSWCRSGSRYNPP